MRLVNLVRTFHEEESGQGFTEYLLIVALLGLAVIAGLSQAATYINQAFSRLGSRVSGYTT